VEEHISRFEGKLDQIHEQITLVNVTLAVQAEQLTNHIRRTEIAEKRLDEIESEVKPIQKHVLHVEGAIKLLGIVATLLGIATAVAGLISYL